MTTMADILPDLRAGRTPHLYDPLYGKVPVTKGHRRDEQGLRGHSVGTAWPFRVVGKGDGTWEVHRNGCAQVMTGMSCKMAHYVAERLAEGWHGH